MNDQILSSEMATLLEYIFFGVFFLGGLAVSILGGIFISRRQRSMILGSTVLVRGISMALSFAYALLMNILVRSSGEEVVSVLSNIYSPVSNLLIITHTALLLAFCRVILRCKVWIIPAVIILAFVNSIANTRMFSFWYQIQSDVIRGKDIRDGVIVPCIIWFAVMMAVLIAENVIIIRTLSRTKTMLPQYSRIDVFYIVFMCISIASVFVPLASLVNSGFYVLADMAVTAASVAAWIVYGIYLVKHAGRAIADN